MVCIKRGVCTPPTSCRIKSIINKMNALKTCFHLRSGLGFSSRRMSFVDPMFPLSTNLSSANAPPQRDKYEQKAVLVLE